MNVLVESLVASNPNAATVEGADRAMIGVTLTVPARAVYSYELLVEHYQSEHGLSESEARDYVDRVVMRGHHGSHAPLFISGGHWGGFSDVED